MRDIDGTLRGYVNVCLHRVHRLLDGQGTQARITCTYHVWTLRLVGKLHGAKGELAREVNFDELGDQYRGRYIGRASFS